MDSFNTRGTPSVSAEDLRLAEEELLARAREVGRRITERVRVVTGDTASHPAWTDETGERRRLG